MSTVFLTQAVRFNAIDGQSFQFKPGLNEVPAGYEKEVAESWFVKAYQADAPSADVDLAAALAEKDQQIAALQAQLAAATAAPAKKGKAADVPAPDASADAPAGDQPSA